MLLRNAHVVALVLALCWGVPAAGQAREDEDTAWISVPADARGLEQLGLSLEQTQRRGDRLELAATRWERRRLEAAGIDVRVVIGDLDAFYAARLLAERSLWAGADPLDSPGFGFGTMGGYYTWDEMIGKLDEMRADYPSLASARQSLGLSHEGRPIWMVTISDDVDRLDEDEPAILFTGLTHAREPMGMEVLLYTMFHLLESYGTDPEVTYLVDHRKLCFVPVVNPDGYVYNQTTNPTGGGTWRKNRRDNGGGVYGVDLNRNYGYRWGWDDQGSSPSPGASTYRGPAPFSEPETSAVRWMHDLQPFTTALHYHAWGGYEIHPFAYQASAFPPAPDLGEYLRYGAVLSSLNGYQVGNFAQTLGYLANGEVLDWSYGEQVEKGKVMAFLTEVGTSSDGFWPPTSRILPLCELHREPNLYWAWIAGSRGELLSTSAGPVVPIGAASRVVVEVENRGYGAVADDLEVELACADPYVSIATARKPFPALGPLQVGDNGADPLEFFVAPNAPKLYAITLSVTLLQGDVLRGTSVVQVVTPATDAP